MRLLSSSIAFVLFISSSMIAQGYADVRRLIDSSEYARAETLVKERLARNASDDSAHFYAGMLVVITGDKAHLDEGAEHLRTCVSMKPNSSGYQLWLGRVLGVKAQNAGIFSAMGYVGEIKGAFMKAVELDPKNFEARYDLVQFYLQAPGIAGGSVSKAKDVAADCAAYDAGMSAVLRAAVQIYKDDYTDARETLTGVGTPSSLLVANYLRSTWISLGFKCLNEKEPEEARQVFEKVIALYPDLAYGFHGLGRSLSDLKRFDEAIPQLEKACSMNNQIGSQYRLAIAWKAKGDNTRAIDYCRRFQSEVRKPNPQTEKDVKALLHDLGAE